MRKRKQADKRGKPRHTGIENDRPAEISRSSRVRHDDDQERVTNRAPLSNEGREVV